MDLHLPSRYENLDQAFRGKLKPDRDLIELIKRSYQSMKIAGGIRFLPVYGKSGCGKSSAAWELAIHMPECVVLKVPRDAISSADIFNDFIGNAINQHNQQKLLVMVIDQYEEAVAERENVPTKFVELLSLLDRSPSALNRQMLFLWLTTSKDFQRALANATSRNQRILAAKDFELPGLPREQWASVIQETFEFHNQGRTLADVDILQDNLEDAARRQETIGSAIEYIANILGNRLAGLQDLSKYQVIMLWPVTDGQRISRISSFTHAREGYKLDWNAWLRELNNEDRRQLPLHAYNRARLYFDVRLVPIAAADLHLLCKNLDDEDFVLQKSYLDRFKQTQFFGIVGGSWDPENFSPLRERESQRAKDARLWYAGVTTSPTKLGRRIAKCFKQLGMEAYYEKEIRTLHGTVRADVLVIRPNAHQSDIIVELKVYSPEQTIPSQIRDAVRTTLRRHAQLAGFLERQ